MLKLYSNIKKYRKQMNMSQQALAEAVGYKGKSMIAQVENGRVNLPASMITKFAEVFNCSENDLIGDDETIDEELATEELLKAITKGKKVQEFTDLFLNASAEDQEKVVNYLKAAQQILDLPRLN